MSIFGIFNFEKQRKKIICENVDTALLFIEESLQLMRKESEEIIVVSFFKNSSTFEMHTPDFVGNRPIMYNLEYYLKRAICFQEKCDFPYNEIKLENSKVIIEIYVEID